MSNKANNDYFFVLRFLEVCPQKIFQKASQWKTKDWGKKIQVLWFLCISHWLLLSYNAWFQFCIKNVSLIQQGLNTKYEKEDRWEKLYFKYNSILILDYPFLSHS